MSNILLILIRNPQLGKVKTRLARTLGDAEALRIYLVLLDRTRRAAQDVEATRWLFYSDFIPEEDAWSASDFIKKVQYPGDLGERMASAFQAAFDAGATKALIIGSDCPDMSGEVLQKAFDALDRSDFVIGPTPDGGYYLLGMKQPERSVFQDIEWSTETVRSRTEEKIQTAGYSCALLPVLSDLDTEEDLPIGL